MPRTFTIPSPWLNAAAGVVALVVGGCAAVAPDRCGSARAPGGCAAAPVPLLAEKLKEPAPRPTLVAEARRNLAMTGKAASRRRAAPVAPIRDRDGANDGTAAEIARAVLANAGGSTPGPTSTLTLTTFPEMAKTSASSSESLATAAIPLARAGRGGEVAALHPGEGERLHVNTVRNLPAAPLPLRAAESPVISPDAPALPEDLGIHGLPAPEAPAAPAPIARDDSADDLFADYDALPASVPTPAPSRAAKPKVKRERTARRVAPVTAAPSPAPAPVPAPEPSAEQSAGRPGRQRGQGWMATEQRDYALRLLPTGEDLGANWQGVNAIAIARSENNQWAPEDGPALADRSSPAIRHFMQYARSSTRIAAAAAYAVPEADGRPGAARLSVSLFFDRFPALPLPVDMFIADMDATNLELGDDGLGRAGRLLGRGRPASKHLPVRRVDPATAEIKMGGPGSGGGGLSSFDIDRPAGVPADRAGDPEAVLMLLDPTPAPAATPVTPTAPAVPESAPRAGIFPEAAHVDAPTTAPAPVTAVTETAEEAVEVQPATPTITSANELDATIAEINLETDTPENELVDVDEIVNLPAQPPVAAPVVVPAVVNEDVIEARPVAPAGEAGEGEAENVEWRDPGGHPPPPADVTDLPAIPPAMGGDAVPSLPPLPPPPPAANQNNDVQAPTLNLDDEEDDDLLILPAPPAPAPAPSASVEVGSPHAYALLTPAGRQVAGKPARRDGARAKPRAERPPVALEKLSPLSFAAFDSLLESIEDELPPTRRRAWLIAEGLVVRIDANTAVTAEQFEEAVRGTRRRLAAALAFERRLRDDSVAQRERRGQAVDSTGYIWNPNATMYWNAMAVVGGVWVFEEY